MTKRYLSCAETAALLRQALKESFPGVKFSVRSKTYSGGASIRVGWTDGPSSNIVEPITDRFEGSYFDGMIDYKGSKTHTLDGECVALMADFVFMQRENSVQAIAAAIQAVVDKYGTELPEGDPVQLYKTGKLWGVPLCQYADHQALMREIGKVLGDAGYPIKAQPSATLARLGFYGDDGYGGGTVGTPGDRDTSKGYPRHA